MSRIMVVEDEGIVALDIKRNLEINGYEVPTIFSSGEEALEQFEHVCPDLVLMDIKLQGDLDGLETADIIKEKYRVPVILLTAFADDSTIERAKPIEPFGYIIKPFEERELRTAIEMALYRSKIERQLHESEERYRSLFNDDLSADFISEPDGNFVACNKSFLRLFKFDSLDKAKKANINDLFLTDEDARLFWSNLWKKKKLELIDMDLKQQDNQKISILANVVADYNKEDKLKEIKGYLIDVSKRKELEHQLRQSQKLEAIGRLAGGIAHDFNNILTVIMGYSTMIKEKLLENENVESDVEGIQRAANKASLLTRQLLAFSRRQVLRPQTLNINNLIKDMDKMLRRLITENITIYMNTTATNPFVYIDAGQFEQVLMNLVVNARDAIDKKGAITIQTKNIILDETVKSQHGTVPAGDYVLIAVADTGCGIEEKYLNLIFEPFFTTKPDEKGTGLGLSTVYGIIKQSNGYLQLKSKKNEGSIFLIYLPLAEEEDQRYQTPSAGSGDYRGSETILLVEDEQAVRELVVRVLLRNGYKVLEASNPGEALLIADSEKDHIDIVITDLIMPYMDGKELVNRLKKIKPDIKTLFMSGYPDKIINEHGIIPDEDYFIPKPFETKDFIYLLRSILDGI